MVEALFKAYFCAGRDVGDLETLAAIAGEVGLPGADTLTERLAGPDGRTEVLDRMAYSRDQGVTGVPFFVFAGTLSLSGAQSEETFLYLLDRAAAQAGGDTAAQCSPEGCI